MENAILGFWVMGWPLSSPCLGVGGRAGSRRACALDVTCHPLLLPGWEPRAWGPVGQSVLCSHHCEEGSVQALGQAGPFHPCV